MTYEDCTYHGIEEPADSDRYEGPRILVEVPGFAPTQRIGVTVLRELRPKDRHELGGFGWGYDGSGTSRAAAAILADALQLSRSERVAISPDDWDETNDKVLVKLREDFCDDVLSQFCDQWRLRRGVVLRWGSRVVPPTPHH